MDLALFGCISGFSTDLPDSLIDDGEEKLVVIGLSLLFDVLAGFFPRGFVFRQGEVAVLCGDDSEILNDIEESVLALSRELPALGDTAGENLLRGPRVLLRCFAGLRCNGGG